MLPRILGMSEINIMPKLSDRSATPSVYPTTTADGRLSSALVFARMVDESSDLFTESSFSIWKWYKNI